MDRIAALARIIATTISFCYMLILLPHVGYIGAGHFMSVFFLAAACIALLWIPLSIFHLWTFGERGRAIRGVSFAPLMLEAAFFVSLFRSM